jgi:putative acetyltransferase
VILIRTYRDADAEALADVYDRSVLAIGPRDYTPEQIAVWIGQGAKADRFRSRMADGRRCWVAVDADDAVHGFIDLEACGHIDFLYVEPEAAGTGLSGFLLDELEAAARADGMERLYVEASEAARRFFLKRDFAVIHRRDFEVEGVAIHNYAMERRL